MELRYKRSYTAKNRRYSVGEIPMLLGYAMEIVEPRPVLSDGKLEPGEFCMILYGITPEEYAWKDGNAHNLDDLEARLRKLAPADRLIGFRICDLKGAAVNRQIKLRLGASMDGGMYASAMKEKSAGIAAGPMDAELLECRRLQKLCADKDAPEGVKADWAQARRNLGAALMGTESIFVPYDVPMRERFPSIGFDGRVEIFTLRSRAENARQQIAAVHAGHDFWQLREIRREEMNGFLGSLASAGVTALRVDNGFAAAELTLKDMRDDVPERNADLRGLMLREIQYGLRWNSLRQDHAPEKNDRGALESMLTLRNLAWRSLGNSVLHVLLALSLPAEGRLCTAAAKQKLMEDDLQVVGVNHCVLVSEKQSGKQWLPVFTDELRAISFGEQVSGNVRPVAVTFDDLIPLCQAAEGILVDPAGMGYRVPKGEFDKVKDLRGKPPVLVRIRSDEADAPQEAPLERNDSEMGSLPDPDQFAPPVQKEEADETPAQEPDSSAETGKGFFAKLFRKKKDS